MKKYANFLCLIMAVAGFSSDGAALASTKDLMRSSSAKCDRRNAIYGPVKIINVSLGIGGAIGKETKDNYSDNTIMFCTPGYLSSSCYLYNRDSDDQEFSITTEYVYVLLLTAYSMNSDVYFYCTENGFANRVHIVN